MQSYCTLSDEQKRELCREEVWKDVVNYEGLYQISTWGGVKSLARLKKIRNGGMQPIPERMLKQCRTVPGDGGRLFVNLWKDNKFKGKLVHRLMLESFVGSCPEGMEACHNDGNHLNNRLDNLRWDTHQNNIGDSVRHGTTNLGKKYKWVRKPGIKFTTEQVLEIRNKSNSGYTNRELSDLYNVTTKTIQDIRLRRSHPLI